MPVEHVREVAARDASLAALERSCDNAFALYVRTRPPASTESLKRARLLPKPGPHPRLVELAEERKLGDAHGDAARADITTALKDFRPAATVLEAQVWPLFI
jgi:ATP-dependent RNA helicase DDX54/DBP10